MNTGNLTDNSTPPPENENSIEYLCRHLGPLQMECLIHFLRRNAKDAGAEAESCKQLEGVICKYFIEAVATDHVIRRVDYSQH